MSTNAAILARILILSFFKNMDSLPTPGSVAPLAGASSCALRERLQV